MKESSFYDPFIYHDDRRQNDLEKASKATQKALKTNNTIRDSSSRQSISVSLEDNTFKVGEYILPSPPQHKPGLSLPKGTPLTLQGRNTQQRREEEAAISPTKLANFTTEQDTLTVTKASSFSRTKKANFAVKFGSQDKSEFKSFEFELPTTPSKPPPSIGTSTTKITTNHPSSSSPKANPQLPGFDFAYNANSASLILGSEEPPAVVDGDPAESSQQLPVFEFGVQYTTPPKTFDFDIPSKHSYPMRLAERPSSIWENNDIGPKERYSARPGNRVDDEKLDFSESTQQVEQEAISEALVETAPIRLEEDPITPNDIPNIECLLPQTPVCKRKEETDEEPFGYAIVTPSSSSYKTYLPARQQHGLLTPPETPETQRHLCNKSTTSARATDFFDSPVSRISSNDSSTIARKPLPNLKDSRPLDDTTPPTDETELVPIAEVCSACGNDKGFEERGCPCCEVSGNEKDQTGCLHSLNLRRLRRLVERRINAGMRRVSCRIESRE